MKQTMEYVNSDTMNFRRQPGHVTVTIKATDNRDAYDVFQKLNRFFSSQAFADIDYETSSGEYTLILHPFAVND